MYGLSMVWHCMTDKSTGTATINQSKMFISISLMIRIDPFHTDTNMFSANIHLFVSWSIRSDTCNSHQSTPPLPRLTYTHTQLGLSNSHQAKGHNYPGCLWHSCLRVRRKAVPALPLLPSSLLFACNIREWVCVWGGGEWMAYLLLWEEKLLIKKNL